MNRYNTAIEAARRDMQRHQDLSITKLNSSFITIKSSTGVETRFYKDQNDPICSRTYNALMNTIEIAIDEYKKRIEATINIQEDENELTKNA